jgi:hypothetical protein
LLLDGSEKAVEFMISNAQGPDTSQTYL